MCILEKFHYSSTLPNTKYNSLTLFWTENILVVYLCFQIYFFIDHLCITQSELTESIENSQKQESPHAWTQEAYCPSCSKYSLCGHRSIMGGVPHPWPGVPPCSDLAGGYPTPGQGYPGIPPILTSLGVPWVLPGRDLEPVEVLWDGDGVPPERTWDQLKYYGMEMGYLPPRGVDRQAPVKTVPSPSFGCGR